jgi:hypothetical protein
MKFTEFVEIEESVKFINELFGSGKKAIDAVKNEKAANEMLRQKKFQNVIFNAFKDHANLVDTLVKAVGKVKDQATKKNLGFVLYLLYAAHGKKGGMFSKGSDSLLNHKDAQIQLGAEKAKGTMDSYIKADKAGGTSDDVTGMDATGDTEKRVNAAQAEKKAKVELEKIKREASKVKAEMQKAKDDAQDARSKADKAKAQKETADLQRQLADMKKEMQAAKADAEEKAKVAAAAKEKPSGENEEEPSSEKEKPENMSDFPDKTQGRPNPDDKKGKSKAK